MIPFDKKPVCKLTTSIKSLRYGMPFAIIGKVVSILKESGDNEGARRFAAMALLIESYDELVKVAHEYVDVN